MFKQGFSNKLMIETILFFLILSLSFSCIMLASKSYAEEHNFEDELIIKIKTEQTKSDFITKDFCPEWLKQSIPLSGIKLKLVKYIVWKRAEVGYNHRARMNAVRNLFGIKCKHNPTQAQRITKIIRSTLPRSGVSDNDPEELSFHYKIEAESSTATEIQPPPFEIPSDQQHSDNYNSCEYYHNLDDTGHLSKINSLMLDYIKLKEQPSNLVSTTYKWYDVDLDKSMKDMLIQMNRLDAEKTAKESDARWLKCHNLYTNNIDTATDEELFAHIRECQSRDELRQLDGIPIVIKDEIAVANYKTSFGLDPSRITGPPLEVVKEQDEADVVKKLRLAGVIILGKANQHIFGLGATGENPHYPKLHNFYNKLHVTGGSSSGCAAAVCTGISPIALGTDGGGSICIPASLNGAVGLKPTEDKITTHGYDNAAPGLVSLGYIGNNVFDVAKAYEVSSGMKPTKAVYNSLKNITIGFDPSFFKGISKEVSHQTLKGLDILCSKLKEYRSDRKSPLREIKCIDGDFRQITWNTHMIKFGKAEADGKYDFVGRGIPLEPTMALCMGNALTSTQLEKVEKNVKLLKAHFKQMYLECDIIVTPTTLTTAPKSVNSATGELNLSKAYQLTSNTLLSNLTGEPRITINCGFDSDNLPIGIQLIGPKHSEYQLMLVAEIFIEALNSKK